LSTNVVEVKITFTLRSVVQQQFQGEVGTFIFFLCQVSSGCCSPVIKICWFFTDLYPQNKNYVIFTMRHYAYCVSMALLSVGISLSVYHIYVLYPDRIYHQTSI